MRLNAVGFASSVLVGLAGPGLSVAAPAVSAALFRLHDALRLTDTQEAAWTTYAAAIARKPQAQS